MGRHNGRPDKNNEWDVSLGTMIICIIAIVVLTFLASVFLFS